MTTIYIDLHSVPLFLRMNFMKGVRETFSATPQSPGRASWNHSRGRPDEACFKVDYPEEKLEQVVKQLTKSLLRNKICHQALDFRDCGSQHTQIKLWHVVKTELQAHATKPTPGAVT